MLPYGSVGQLIYKNKEMENKNNDKKIMLTAINIITAIISIVAVVSLGLGSILNMPNVVKNQEAMMKTQTIILDKLDSSNANLLKFTMFYNLELSKKVDKEIYEKDLKETQKKLAYLQTQTIRICDKIGVSIKYQESEARLRDSMGKIYLHYIALYSKQYLQDNNKDCTNKIIIKNIDTNNNNALLTKKCN